MALFTSSKIETLHDLFLMELHDLHSAERQLVDALPKMEEAASSPELKHAFRDHLQETRRQVERLDECLRLLDEKPNGKTCEAMKGLIEEGEEIVKLKGDSDVKDAGLIAAAQRVEHYEISGYGTAVALADRMGHEELSALLSETLAEEKAADHLLNQIAKSDVNPRAKKKG